MHTGVLIQCECYSAPQAVVTLHVTELTNEATVEHPGSHQHKGEQEEDEVVMVPRTLGKKKKDQITINSNAANLKSDSVQESYRCSSWSRWSGGPALPRRRHS